MQIVRVGLCEGRHTISSNDGEEVNEFIFSIIENPNDFKTLEKKAYDFFNNVWDYGDEPVIVELYITGLSQALTSTLNAYIRNIDAINDGLGQKGSNKIALKLMHYNRDTEKYEVQNFGGI